jgi:hypothetical protein
LLPPVFSGEQSNEEAAIGKTPWFLGCPTAIFQKRRCVT